jgi:hypothetical protein
MAAPDLSLYMGQRVISITYGDETWEWGIKLESGVEIRNKDVRETFHPTKLVNMRFQSMSVSERDTTLHFMGAGATKVSIGLKPTGYAIFDPKHGSEIYPQWTEELEEMGITANEGMAPPRSAPAPEWEREESRLKKTRDGRIAGEATEFLADTEKS